MKVLALAPRGFVRDDVLHLSKLSARLRVEWRSRDVHPWARDLPSARRAELSRAQTLDDTDAAIVRFFQMLPEMDVIEVGVLEPHPPHRLLLSGTVLRAEAVATRSLSSPAMRLKMMGIRCHSDGG
jgi:hypothetical protein